MTPARAKNILDQANAYPYPNTKNLEQECLKLMTDDEIIFVRTYGDDIVRALKLIAAGK